MSPAEITRAWKDCVFREHLTDAERALVPAHPAGASAGRPPFDQTPANYAGGMLPSTPRTVGSVSCDFFTNGCCA